MITLVWEFRNWKRIDNALRHCTMNMSEVSQALKSRNGNPNQIQMIQKVIEFICRPKESNEWKRELRGKQLAPHKQGLAKSMRIGI